MKKITTTGSSANFLSPDSNGKGFDQWSKLFFNLNAHPQIQILNRIKIVYHDPRLSSSWIEVSVSFLKPGNVLVGYAKIVPSIILSIDTTAAP